MAMRDTAPLRAELIKHLEEALVLADQIHDPMTGYLVETALDAARAGQWPNYEDGNGGPARSKR
jgi:hypothetical protein